MIHNLPPKPDYFRVKIWRRLQRIGAVAIKNSVYVMPRSDQALEDLQWTLREITEGHGEASICEADFVDGLSDDQVEALFKAARDADYAAIAEEARRFVRAARAGAAHDHDKSDELEPAVARLRRRLGEVVAIDFFDSLGRQTAEGLVASLEASLQREPPIEEDSTSLPLHEYRKRIWVTRKGLHIDRMASAWLVRCFIDADAVFKFVPARGYRPEKDEVRFDMFQAEFTHEGDRCTFEVLIQRMKLRDAALRAIGEIIHDIDLKDAKFDRQEAAGIDRVITGICRAYKDDESRLARGSALFDDLYASFVRKGR
ncbi:MAG: chromate resistance protein ChrB domain-containing protein [Candidatus Binataceae bacterium]